MQILFPSAFDNSLCRPVLYPIKYKQIQSNKDKYMSKCQLNIN